VVHSWHKVASGPKSCSHMRCFISMRAMPNISQSRHEKCSVQYEQLATWASTTALLLICACVLAAYLDQNDFTSLWLPMSRLCNQPVADQRVRP
jgi:hypothetical protein